MAESFTSLEVSPHEDSMMFHFPNHIHGGAVSQLLNLRNIAIKEDTFREDIVRIVNETKAEALISGAIAPMPEDITEFSSFS